MTSGDVTAGPRPEIHHAHNEAPRTWLRPSVFGLTDGLVSNFALIAGIAAADVGRHPLIVAGVAGLVGGAFSMASGEWISVKSQNEATDAEIAVERYELLHNAGNELKELIQLFIDRGVEPVLAAEVSKQLSSDPDRALAIHAREELGVDPDSLPSPFVAAGSSLLSFSIGALVPLVPYLAGARSLVISVIVALITLFVAGSLTARFTTRGWLFSGVRQLLVGLAAAAVTYGIGALFGVAIN